MNSYFTVFKDIFEKEFWLLMNEVIIVPLNLIFFISLQGIQGLRNNFQ